MNSLVSIIIPTYNRADMLKEAIQSILNQTYQFFEIIIIDDGSDDHTGKVIGGFDDDRINLIQLPHTGLISHNRNKGLEQSKGEFIAFLDSDDLWIETKLEKQLEIMQDQTLDFTFSDALIYYEDEKEGRNIYTALLRDKNIILKKRMLEDIIFNRLAIYISTFLMRKRVLVEESYFDTTMKISEMIYIGRIASKFKGYLDFTSLVKIRKHQNNTSAIDFKLLYGEKIKLAKSLFSESRISKAAFRKSCAIHFYALSLVLNDTADIREALFSCIKYRPFYLKAYYRLFKTWP